MIDRVDALARRQGLSRNKLLQACGVKSYVDNLKKGQLPKVDTAAKIADYCNVSIDYVLCRTDNPQIAPPQGEAIITKEKRNGEMNNIELYASIVNSITKMSKFLADASQQAINPSMEMRNVFAKIAEIQNRLANQQTPIVLSRIFEAQLISPEKLEYIRKRCEELDVTNIKDTGETIESMLLFFEDYDSAEAGLKTQMNHSGAKEPELSAEAKEVGKAYDALATGKEKNTVRYVLGLPMRELHEKEA